MSLDQLIAIDTQNPGADYTQIRRFLTTALEARGARVRLFAGNVLGTWGTPRLLFNAHMDTVRADGWSRNPLKAWTKNGRIYGLGACDTKGSIQAILDATANEAGNLAVLFSTDEECGPKTGAAKFFKTPAGGNLAKHLKGAVVMEPTENHVITRHPGYVHIELSFCGTSGHSSSLKQSAASQAVETLHRLQHYAGWNVNVSDLKALAAGANIRVASCHTTASIRSYQKPEAVVKKIRTALPSGVRMHVVQAEGPLDNNRPFVGRKKEVPFWTDAATLQSAGINTVVYGAGSIKQAHKPKEYVTKTSLKKAAAFLKKVAGIRK